MQVFNKLIHGIFGKYEPCIYLVFQIYESEILLAVILSALPKLLGVSLRLKFSILLNLFGYSNSFIFVEFIFILFNLLLIKSQFNLPFFASVVLFLIK